MIQLQLWLNATIRIWCRVFGHMPVETTAYNGTGDERQIVWCTRCHLWYEVM